MEAKTKVSLSYILKHSTDTYLQMIFLSHCIYKVSPVLSFDYKQYNLTLPLILLICVYVSCVYIYCRLERPPSIGLPSMLMMPL